MTRFYLVALLAVLCFSVKAEDCDVQKLEFEANIGMSTPIGCWRGSKNVPGAALGLALRYNPNLEAKPISFGGLIQLDCAHHEFSDRPDHTHNQNNRTLTIAALVEYDFNKCGKVNPFASVAVGYCHHDVVGYKAYWISSDNSAVFMPRVGVEFWHFLRIQCYTQFSRKGFNTFGANLGIVLGGRPRRR